MSADEFDPAIERLFARSPHMPDAADFAARVERRLDNGSRLRTVALSLAGLIGGVVAVREAVGSNFSFQAEQAGDGATRLVSSGLDSVATQAQTSVQGGLESLGVGAGLDMTMAGGMPMFWVATAVILAAVTTAMLKLTDQI